MVPFEPRYELSLAVRTTTALPSQSWRWTKGSFVLHPCALGALVLWALNDHLLKGNGPGFLTGKLSDVAGLIFFPLLIAALIEVLGFLLRRDWTLSKRPMQIALIYTIVLYVGINLVPWFDAQHEVFLGYVRWPLDALTALLQGAEVGPVRSVVLTLDPTDLILLPLLWLPHRIYSRWRLA